MPRGPVDTDLPDQTHRYLRAPGQSHECPRRAGAAPFALLRGYTARRLSFFAPHVLSCHLKVEGTRSVLYAWFAFRDCLVAATTSLRSYGLSHLRYTLSPNPSSIFFCSGWRDFEMTFLPFSAPSCPVCFRLPSDPISLRGDFNSAPRELVEAAHVLIGARSILATRLLWGGLL